MKGELFLFLRKGEDIPVFDGVFTIENHYAFLSESMAAIRFVDAM